MGFAKITINDAICIDGIKIINGEKGLFIGMPSSKGKDNQYRDIVFPINKETRQMLTDQILDEYKKKDDSDDNHF